MAYKDGKEYIVETPTIKKLKDVGDSTLYFWDYHPHLGFVYPGKYGTMVGTLFHYLNPVSKDLLAKIKVGDLIQVKFNLDSKVFDEIKTPEDLKTKEEHIFTVHQIVNDIFENPIIWFKI
jgi:hypothetical protein